MAESGKGLSQNGYDSVYMGQTETSTPRGVVGFVFLQVMTEDLIPRRVWARAHLLKPLPWVFSDVATVAYNPLDVDPASPSVDGRFRRRALPGATGQTLQVLLHRVQVLMQPQ